MKKKGQAVLEYALLISIVAAAFIMMNGYIRNAVQAKLNEMSGRVAPTGRVIGE